MRDEPPKPRTIPLPLLRRQVLAGGVGRFWQAEFGSIAPRRPATPRIRKPTLETDFYETNVGVSRGPTTTTIASLEGEEGEVAEINNEPVEEDEAGEVEFPNQRRIQSPPAADVEEHRLTHWFFRSWCGFCNLGRGTGEQHRRDPGTQRSIAIAGIDDWYIASGS